MKRLITQLQPTPTLYGQDAKDVIRQIYKKQNKEDKEKAEIRKSMFARVKKKGLR